MTKFKQTSSNFFDILELRVKEIELGLNLGKLPIKLPKKSKFHTINNQLRKIVKDLTE